MARKKPNKIKLKEKKELQKMAFKLTKNLIEGPYELTGRDFEKIYDIIEWSDDALGNIYQLNLNLIQKYPFKTFYDKETGELIGMFNGYHYDQLNISDVRKRTINIQNILYRMQKELQVPPEARLIKQRLFNFEENEIEILQDVDFPRGRYVRFEWRHKGSNHFKEGKNKVLDFNKFDSLYIESYYNLDLDRLVYFYKNWYI